MLEELSTLNTYWEIQDKNDTNESEFAFTCQDKQKSCTSGKMKKEYIWVLDSGASAHMCGIKKGYEKLTPINTKIQMALKDSKSTVKAKGKWSGANFIHDEKTNTYIKSKNNIHLEDTLYVPGLEHNLFSLTKALSKGGKVTNEGDIMIVECNGLKLRFDQKLGTSKGHVMATIIVPNGEMETQMTKMDINLFHNITHFSENYLKGTANRIGITLTGKLKECIHCARSKAKRTKIKKIMPNKALYPGERIAIDVSSTKTKLQGKFSCFCKNR